MDWLRYLFVFLVICIIWFFITRIWVGSIDLIISGFKKLLRLDKKNNTKKWHALEEIRDKQKKD